MLNTHSDTHLDWLVEADSSCSSLDLFSTSATLFRTCASPVLRCVNNAPFFAYCVGGSKYKIVQGNCNSWNCPRCGELVAKSHYGRIVEGCRTLAKESELYFITLTCKGRELSEKEAFENYGKWTHKFLDACSAKQRRLDKKNGSGKSTWSYVQVTEKQKRGHPHSHVLTTFKPQDIQLGTVDKWSKGNDGKLSCEKVECLRSDWVLEQSVKSGLGTQYDISQVSSVEACSRYVAKYMFKASQFEQVFPKGWKRVRYAQSFPKLPEKETNAFVLLSREDWAKLTYLAAHVITDEQSAFEASEYFLRGSDTFVTFKEKQKHEKANGQISSSDRR